VWWHAAGAASSVQPCSRLLYRGIPCNSQDERGKDMIFSVDSKPSMRAASAARPTGAFGQRYPINLAAKADSPAVANVSATPISQY
jgi:hypothetical protein